MLYPLDQIEQQLSRTEHQLMFHLIKEQQETNRLLNELLGQPEETLDVKRPELMKRMAKLQNKPQGWNKWSNDQIIDHLKGVG